jgi:serine/threonine protein kinase
MFIHACIRSLAHPHIVRCLGIHIESSGDKYMVVEYVDGGSLVSLLRKKQADLTLDNLLQMYALSDFPMC